MTDVQTIDKNRMLELLELVVNREGADTKAECKYVMNDAPQCIGAHVLTELGVTLDELRAREDKSVHVFRGILSSRNVSVDEDVLDVLYCAQLRQDSGHTWGDALESARAFAEGQS